MILNPECVSQYQFCFRPGDSQVCNHLQVQKNLKKSYPTLQSALCLPMIINTTESVALISFSLYMVAVGLPNGHPA